MRLWVDRLSVYARGNTTFATDPATQRRDSGPALTDFRGCQPVSEIGRLSSVGLLP